MERLTRKTWVGDYASANDKIMFEHQEEYNKLGKYEDTGLTPEEIKELAEAKAELDKLSFPVYGGAKINGKPVVAADLLEGTMTIQVAEPITLEELKALREEAEAALLKEQSNEL